MTQKATDCALNPFQVARTPAAGTQQVCGAGTWDTAIDDETPGGDSTAPFVGLERCWNWPTLTTQEPIYQQLSTSAHCAADLRGVSSPRIAKRDWNPSKTSQPVPFFLIKNSSSIASIHRRTNCQVDNVPEPIARVTLEPVQAIGISVVSRRTVWGRIRPFKNVEDVGGRQIILRRNPIQVWLTRVAHNPVGRVQSLDLCQYARPTEFGDLPAMVTYNAVTKTLPLMPLPVLDVTAVKSAVSAVWLTPDASC